MDRKELGRQQSELLEKQIWNESTPQLQAVEASLPVSLQHLGLNVFEVLAGVSDEGLIVAIQKGFLTDHAFEELMENRYKTCVFRWFHRCWRSGLEDAKDLIQDLILRLWQTKFRTYQPQEVNSENFRYWLWRVAFNLRIEHQRERKRRRETCSQQYCPAPPAIGSDPGDEAEGREFETRVNAKLAELPEDERRVLQETMNGRTADEIAALIGCGRPKIYRLLFWARRHLEQKLGIS